MIGGDAGCPHAPVDHEFLGLFGASAMYQCRGCGGVLVVPPE